MLDYCAASFRCTRHCHKTLTGGSFTGLGIRIALPLWAHSCGLWFAAIQPALLRLSTHSACSAGRFFFSLRGITTHRRRCLQVSWRCRRNAAWAFPWQRVYARWHATRALSLRSAQAMVSCCNNMTTPHQLFSHTLHLPHFALAALLS